MTSIDSGEMTFARNTGDFVRIIRLCYLKPYLPNENNDNNNDNISSIINWKPSAPIYLQCKNIVSINNSLKELQQQMNDYLLKARKNEYHNSANYQYYTGGEIERWRFICADSVAIFISNISNSGDSRNRRNIIMSDCDKSFHAITISSNHASMNRKMLNGINIYYDIGLYGRRPKSNITLSLNDNQNNDNNDKFNNGNSVNQNDDIDNNDNDDVDNVKNNNGHKKERQKNRSDSALTTTNTDQNSCLII